MVLQTFIQKITSIENKSFAEKDLTLKILFGSRLIKKDGNLAILE